MCFPGEAMFAFKAISHIHRNRTETVTAIELHRFVFGRPFTYEPNHWKKSKKMPVYFGLISLSDSRNNFYNTNCSMSLH